MNSDMARLCRAAQNAQPARPGVALAMKDIVRTVLTEMLTPSESISEYMVASVESRIGSEEMQSYPHVGAVAIAGYSGGVIGFLREED